MTDEEDDDDDDEEETGAEGHAEVKGSNFFSSIFNMIRFLNSSPVYCLVRSPSISWAKLVQPSVVAMPVRDLAFHAYNCGRGDLVLLSTATGFTVGQVVGDSPMDSDSSMSCKLVADFVARPIDRRNTIKAPFESFLPLTKLLFNNCFTTVLYSVEPFTGNLEAISFKVRKVLFCPAVNSTSRKHEIGQQSTEFSFDG